MIPVSPDPNDPQARLLQLLALKRYEVPPPGFFQQLPRRIGAQLNSASAPPPSRWRALWQEWISQPAVGLSYAALAVGAVLFGVSVFHIASEPDPSLASSWGTGLGTATHPPMAFHADTPDPSQMTLPWMAFPVKPGSAEPPGFPVVRPASLDVQPNRP